MQLRPSKQFALKHCMQFARHSFPLENRVPCLFNNDVAVLTLSMQTILDIGVACVKVGITQRSAEWFLLTPASEPTVSSTETRSMGEGRCCRLCDSRVVRHQKLLTVVSTAYMLYQTRVHQFIKQALLLSVPGLACQTDPRQKTLQKLSDHQKTCLPGL